MPKHGPVKKMPKGKKPPVTKDMNKMMKKMPKCP